MRLLRLPRLRGLRIRLCSHGRRDTWKGWLQVCVGRTNDKTEREMKRDKHSDGVRHRRRHRHGHRQAQAKTQTQAQTQSEHPACRSRMVT
jgi:hypothetical protein